MPYDGTVEWVLKNAQEARDLIELQRAILARRVQPVTPIPTVTQTAPPAKRPWWRIF